MPITYELLFVGLLAGTLGIRVSMLLVEGYRLHSGKQYFGIRALNLWANEAICGA
jgi:hypothetical protein